MPGKPQMFGPSSAGTPQVVGPAPPTGTPRTYDSGVLFDQMPGTFDETPGTFDEAQLP